MDHHETCEEFYKSLNETINNNPHKNDNQLIIMGDFNSKISQREMNEERIWVLTTDEGKYLLTFAKKTI